MPVTGIGGLFFRARDPEALAGWYRRHFGMGEAPYGEWRQEAGPTVFAPFPAGSDYFAIDKAFMLNLRVTDLDGLLASLRTAGIEPIINDDWNALETGRFARVHDPEGNAVELWEPPGANDPAM